MNPGTLGWLLCSLTELQFLICSINKHVYRGLRANIIQGTRGAKRITGPIQVAHRLMVQWEEQMDTQ